MASLHNQYPYLTFAPHVDYEHVSPELLSKMNSLGRSLGKSIDIISGYRSDAYSARVGGFKGDPHTKGLAVDAYIDGRPIGEVVGVKRLSVLGLRSGNVPNFYNGKPDPEHVDIAAPPTEGGDVPMSTQGGTTTPPAAPPSVSAADLIGQDVASRPPNNMEPHVGANTISPDITPDLSVSSHPSYETWQLLAALPGASADTIRLAQLAGLQGNAASG